AGCQGTPMQYAAPAGCHGSSAGYRATYYTPAYSTPMYYTAPAGCQGGFPGGPSDPNLKARLDTLEEDVRVLKSLPGEVATLRKNMETNNASTAEILKALQADFRELKK